MHWCRVQGVYMTEETEVVEEVTAQVEEQPPQPEEAVKKEADHNWEQAHQLLKLQRQKIEELEAQVQQKSAPSKEEDDEDEFADLDPEDYIKVGSAKEKFKKLASKEAEKKAKQIVTEYAQQMRITQDEERMRNKHEDFEYVIKNFAIPLINNDPALAYQIQNSKNPAETAYKLGKLSDAYKEQNMSKSPSPKAEKILKNSNRPVSSAAAGSVLKSQADQFSKLDPRNSQDRQRIYELSQQYARGA